MLSWQRCPREKCGSRALASEHALTGVPSIRRHPTGMYCSSVVGATRYRAALSQPLAVVLRHTLDALDFSSSSILILSSVTLPRFLSPRVPSPPARVDLTRAVVCTFYASLILPFPLIPADTTSLSPAWQLPSGRRWPNMTKYQRRRLPPQLSEPRNGPHHTNG